MGKNKFYKFKYLRKFIQLRKNLFSYSQTHFIPGSGKISFFDFFRIFFQGILNESISMRASALSYKLFLAFFPALIFLVTLLPYLSTFGSQETFMETIESIMPEYSFKAFESTLRDVLFNPRFELLSVVFVLSLVYSISNMNSIVDTFNKSYHFKDKRKFSKKIIISSILTLLFYLLIIITITLMSISEIVLNWMYYEEFFKSSIYFLLLNYGRWLILFFVMLTGLSVFYNIATPYKLKFRFFNPGSLFSAFFFIILSIGFNIFVNQFASYNKVYGVLGVILVFFMWLYYNAAIVLIGFEINASIYVAPRAKETIT